MSSAAGDREQKMLDSTTQNLSERLTEVRKTLGTLITKVSLSDILHLILDLVRYPILLDQTYFHILNNRCRYNIYRWRQIHV